jgi:ketosteroid isomerase-like protein
VTGADVVRAYYRLVDAQDVDGVLELFCQDAVYVRPGYDTFRGVDSLRRFYSGERVIATGRHELDEVVEAVRSVAVQGRFSGRLRDGSACSCRFADFFRLTADDRIAHRCTYFAVPLV